MPLCLYTKGDVGYRELEYEALTHEQAIAIGDLIHQTAVDYSDIRELTVLSMRVIQALQMIRPKVVTIRDLKEKPLESWREHTFMDKHIYDELRETVRPFGVRLPAWELLP